MTFRYLIVERRGHVGWIVLNRPATFNALNEAMVQDELPRAWVAHDEDSEVRVIVVTGEGKGFCSGVDMTEVSSDERGMARHAERVEPEALRFTSLRNNIWKPVICAVNGVCAGGGLLFVNDADIVIAASTATFLDPHVSVGQVSVHEPIGLLSRLPIEAVARMLFLGRHERMTASRAYELGMVSQIVDPPQGLRDAAQALGDKIATNSPSAMMASKKALRGALETGMTDAMRAGAKLLQQFWDHPDNTEGPAAFAEKRDAAWAPPTREL